MKRRTTLRECEFCKITSALRIRKCCAEGMKQDMSKSVFILITGKIENGVHSMSYRILKVAKKIKKLLEHVTIENSKKDVSLRLRPHERSKNCWVNSMEYYEIIEREVL